MLPNRAIIFASGASIKEGLPLGLSNYLEREVIFSINDNNKFFYSTVAMFGDWTAYRDRFEIYSKHPLSIGCYDNHIGRTIEGSLPCPKHNSLILLQGSGKYNGEKGLEQGLYSRILTGAFTLNLAIRLGFKQIYLLGFDNCEVNGSTHWYDQDKTAGQYTDYEGKPFTGVGKDINNNYKTSFYNNDDTIINDLWEPFRVEFDKVKIYNVSLPSRITVFDKIGYYSFIKILNEIPIEVNQEEAQNDIRKFLQPYNKA